MERLKSIAETQNKLMEQLVHHMSQQNHPSAITTNEGSKDVSFIRSVIRSGDEDTEIHAREVLQIPPELPATGAKVRRVRGPDKGPRKRRKVANDNVF